MKALELLVDAGDLAPIDAQLGGLLARRAAASLGDLSEVGVVALAGALLSAERARGNSCMDLATLAYAPAWPHVAGSLRRDPATCRAILLRSTLCRDGDDGAPLPLVLDGDRLYMHRYHAAERRLARAVRSRLGEERDPAPVPPAGTVALFRALFDVGRDTPVNWQGVAAASAMLGRLTVVTGGPGTGKTTTVARILALLLHMDPTLRVALAAPTGKAAARLGAAIAGVAATLPVEPELRERIPTDGCTLHRLLRYQPWCDRYEHSAANPLAHDVIVVDEASMADLLQMDALFAAARGGARLVLLGDPDQLASVETGFVLGDICRAADTYGPSHGPVLASWYGSLSGQEIPAAATATALRDSVIRLERSYRFEARPGIGALAGAVRDGDAVRALEVLADPALPEVSRRDPVRSAAELIAPIEELIERYLAASEPREALGALDAFRVLCALRDGSAGVSGLNDAIERWLVARGVPARARWYDRRPVLVTANDPATGLYNGDVGVTFQYGGRTAVFFASSDGDAREVSPARLPEHETAWAMTVHKAQGSEFDRVVLVLPGGDARILTRELLYTAVTRARETVDVVGTTAAVEAGVRRRTARSSGLAERLSGA